MTNNMSRLAISSQVGFLVLQPSAEIRLKNSECSTRRQVILDGRTTGGVKQAILESDAELSMSFFFIVVFMKQIAGFVIDNLLIRALLKLPVAMSREGVMFDLNQELALKAALYPLDEAIVAWNS